MRYLRGVPLQAWSDVVTLNEAWELLAKPGKLAERLNEAPKEDAPPPKPGSIGPLHQLPGFSLKLKNGQALKKAVMNAMDYHKRQIGITPASGLTFEGNSPDSTVPVFIL